jgi:hypothetical protein
VARRLRDALGWTPAYWISRPKNHAEIRAAFPACVAHPFLDLCRGLPATGQETLARRALSLAELDAASRFQPTALELMDRMDLGRRWSYGERQRLFNKLLMYALGAIEAHRLELAVFNVPPHSIGEYVFYVAFRIRGLPVRVFRPTPVNALHFLCDTVERLPPHLASAYAARLQRGAHQVSAKVRAEIDAIAAAQADFRPWYLTKAQERQGRRERVYDQLEPRVQRGELSYEGLRIGESILERRPQEGDDEPVRRSFKRPGLPLAAPTMTKREYRTYRDWAAIAKLKLRERYEALCSSADLDAPFVYFALHYQPERTSCPDGDRFSDQFLALALVAAALPPDWGLYVKEHPSQFAYLGQGELSRWSEYYDEIAALPNVRLVPTTVSSIDLIDRSRAVASVAGAVGWEALVRGRPALCFGAAWYGACRGAWRLESADEARAALARIAAGERPSREQVLAYAGALEDVGRVCYTNTSLARSVQADLSGQEDALFGLLHDYERNYAAP